MSDDSKSEMLSVEEFRELKRRIEALEVALEWARNGVDPRVAQVLNMTPYNPDLFPRRNSQLEK